jgi:GT2 family glycosyltransferase
MDKVAIIVLNYLNYKDTIECIESIAIDQYPLKEIIIVDNGSTNDSKAKLEEMFRNNDEIHLLANDKNAGFARGNNLGIRYARDILGCSFVLLVNNDTIFNDPNMITTLMGAYEPGVGVLGPRILAADGPEQNPARVMVRGNLQQHLYYWRIRLKQSCLYQSLKRLRPNIFRKKKKKNGKIARNNLAFKSITSANLVLHGSCFLLTTDYFKYYPWLFPGTFLFYEEAILTILTGKVGLVKKFVHTTYIFHKEHQATEMSFEHKNKKTEYFTDSLKMANEIYSLNYKTLIELYFKP